MFIEKRAATVSRLDWSGNLVGYNVPFESSLGTYDAVSNLNFFPPPYSLT